jgi:hypothetical protein
VAFTSDLTLDDASGDDVVYRLVSTDNQGTRRIDIATNLSEPAFLAIRHSQSGKGADLVDRHLLQVTETKIDSGGTPRTLTLNITLNVPRNAIVTSQMVKDRLTNLLDLLTDGAIASLATSANIDSLLRGES